jgi:hypothetical protein
MNFFTFALTSITLTIEIYCLFFFIGTFLTRIFFCLVLFDWESHMGGVGRSIQFCFLWHMSHLVFGLFMTKSFSVFVYTLELSVSFNNILYVILYLLSFSFICCPLSLLIFETGIFLYFDEIYKKGIWKKLG